MNRRLVLAGLTLAAALAVPAGVIAAPSTTEFTGSWVSVDTDGSDQTLVVSGGAQPSVIYQDFFANGCDRFGGPATHWVGAGKGSVEEGTLFVVFHKSGCGRLLQGGYEDWFVYEAGSDTLEDSFGIIWTRA